MTDHEKDLITIVERDKRGRVLSEKKVRLEELYANEKDVALKLAREDFLHYVKPKVICARYGIPPNVLSTHAYGRRGKNGHKGWKADRERLEDEAIDALISEKREDMEKILHLSSNIIMRILARYEAKEAPDTIEEANRISQLMTNVHKVLRLEGDKPTEIVKETHSMEDIMAQLKEMDDFCDYEIPDEDVH